MSKSLRLRLVSALALVTVALFHRLSVALVMLDKPVTVTLVLTKYSLPNSLLRTYMLLVLGKMAVVKVGVGAVMSKV